MPVGPARMPLFDHLGELRMRLVRIIACLAIAVVVFYMATPIISQFLLQPISPYLPEGTDGLLAGTIVLDPFEAFATRFKISMLVLPLSYGRFLRSFCRRSSRASASGSFPRLPRP